MHKQRNQWGAATAGQWLQGAKAFVEHSGFAMYTQEDFPATERLMKSLIGNLK
jgi:hypothetical protein